MGLRKISEYNFRLKRESTTVTGELKNEIYGDHNFYWCTKGMFYTSIWTISSEEKCVASESEIANGDVGS